MPKKDHLKTKNEDFSIKATRWIGSKDSLYVHTGVFACAILLMFFGAETSDVLLILTTAVSLEAIYLAIFIQMTVNKNTEDIEEIQEDVEEIQEDVEEIQEDVEEIQEDVESIEKDVDEIQEDVEEIEKDVDEIQEDVEEIEKGVDEIQEEVEDINQELVSDTPEVAPLVPSPYKSVTKDTEVILSSLLIEIQNLRKDISSIKQETKVKSKKSQKVISKVVKPQTKKRA